MCDQKALPINVITPLLGRLVANAAQQHFIRNNKKKGKKSNKEAFLKKPQLNSALRSQRKPVFRS